MEALWILFLCKRGNQIQLFPTSGIIQQFNTMPKSERKFFLCTGQVVPAEHLCKHPDSHIIGELRYVMDGNDQHKRAVTALAVYETACSTENAPAALPDIRVEIVGDARNIKCTCCDNHENWEIGKAAFLQLMSRYGKRVE